jgi:hypothetical protein
MSKMKPLTFTQIKYCDDNHPDIRRLASKLSHVGQTDTERFASIFHYVRDEIKFGFPPKWERVRASETLKYGMGYCNTKSILLAAVCRAAGIPAKLHFGLIKMEIMDHIFPKWVFQFMPKIASHGWVEVKLAGEWHPVDAHILDFSFFQGASHALKKAQKPIGFGVAYLLPKCTADWDSGFVQTHGVVTDHGQWDDAQAYYKSNLYVGLKWWQLLSYPILRRIGNNNIDKIRNIRISEKVSGPEKLKLVS